MEGAATVRLFEQLREQIEERIVTGLYPPGTRLDEVELAEGFGVSRTPIREALIQLSSEGFIEIRPRRGAIVAQIPPGRLCEMFDVMAELEAMCGRLAARRASTADIERIQQAHQACQAARAANDPDSYYRLNETFHFAIYEASHNGFLTEQATGLHRRLRPYRRLQLRVRNRMDSSFAEHADIVAAIARGDAEAAMDRLRQHVTVQGERFADLIASIDAVDRERRARGPVRKSA